MLLIGGGWLLVDWFWSLPPGKTRSYVGRQSCAQCHVKETAAWTGSHHDLAMQEADETTILGKFDGQTFDRFGVKSRFFRQERAFCVETSGPDGKPEIYTVKYAFGIDPLQQYLVEFPDGRYQVLPLCWDTRNKVWFHLHHHEPLSPQDPLYWTNVGSTWNHMCAECHSTDVQKNFNAHSNSYRTSFREIDVSCEACHGPGSLHVELAQAKSPFWDRYYGKGLAVNLKDPENRTQIDMCAKCHARSGSLAEGLGPGKKYHDHKTLQLLEERLYHDDGQILDEVFEHGSFLQSKMFRMNVRCTDCHDPHSGKLEAPGNQMCAKCHQPAKYDAPNHHHHAAGSTGAQCVECHMPQRKYMVVHERHDHSLRIPRPDLTQKIGSPNACNQCHDEIQTPDQKGESAAQRTAWAVQAIEKWYGPKRRDDPHYGEILAAARQGQPAALPELEKLARSPNVGPNVRASAVRYLANYPPAQQRDALERALADPESMVRAAAVANLIPELLIPRAKELLGDSSREVRFAAVRRLAAVDFQPYLDEVTQAVLGAVLDEYLATRIQDLDTEAENLMLGSLALLRSRFAEGRDYFQRALTINRRGSAAWISLAATHGLLERPDEAIKTLREGIEVNTAYVAELRENLKLITHKDTRADVERDIQIMSEFLGTLEAQLARRLAVNEAGLAEANKLLEQAIGHDEKNSGHRLAMALVQRQLKNLPEAEKQFTAALQLDPTALAAVEPLAEVLLEQRKTAASEALLIAALKSQTRPEWVILLAQTYRARELRDKEEELLRDYARRAPQALILQRLVEVLQERGKAEDAKPFLEQLENWRRQRE